MFWRWEHTLVITYLGTDMYLVVQISKAAAPAIFHILTRLGRRDLYSRRYPSGYSRILSMWASVLSACSTRFSGKNTMGGLFFCFRTSLDGSSDFQGPRQHGSDGNDGGYPLEAGAVVGGFQCMCGVCIGASCRPLRPQLTAVCRVLSMFSLLSSRPLGGQGLVSRLTSVHCLGVLKCNARQLNPICQICSDAFHLARARLPVSLPASQPAKQKIVGGIQGRCLSYSVVL